MYEEFCEAAESILDQTYDDVELVVVVDGTDIVHERVRDEYGDCEDVIIHCNAENVGLLESRNTGAEIASGDIIAFIDDDAVADEQWIENLVESYKKQDVIAVGGTMTGEWVAGKPGFLPEEFYWLVGVTHRGFADGPGEVRNTFGSNISFRRDVFLELGGFDTEIGGRKGDVNLQGGETELCARMREEYDQGIWYNPDAIVAHKIFDYRTRLFWLVDRAFWQGYSKRAMESFVSNSGEEENDFLQKLIFKFVPEHVWGVLKSPSADRLSQLILLFVFIGAVGFGYLYGILRWYNEANNTAK
jgi:glycosyltransferase involved in cell wall biosynthesis